MTSSQTEERIIKALQETSVELHTEEIAERLGLARHTTSKYLQVLYAKRSVRMRRVGNAKLWQAAASAIEIRSLRPEDLPRILQIEGRLQRLRQEALHIPEAPGGLQTFAKTVKHHLQCSDPTFCLGAELGGELVGFIIAEVRLWEFGEGEETGWIKILAVDPDHQRCGIGRRLGEALLRHLRRRDILCVRTLVGSYSGELIAYFRGLGFQIVNMLPLELRMDTPTGEPMS
ncbi:MAG TPA: GNAT family N-acetyltransferase [Candidatus Fraserbacteria bacterium]|nr:GNAT family N-acetyltransferase [Candidatus Fraserbacteria bacterium]